MSKHKNIVYIVSKFPSTSQTFVLRELMELEEKGYQISVYSMFNSSEEIKHNEVTSFQGKVIYFPQVKTIFKDFMFAMLKNIKVFIKHPLRYVKAFWKIVKARKPKLILDLIRAAWLVGSYPEIKNVHMHAQFAHNPTSIAYFVKLLANNSFSFTCHAVDIFVHTALLKEKIEESKFFATISNYNINYLRERYGEIVLKKANIIRCGISESEIQNDKVVDFDSNKVTIFSIGRMVEKKGFNLLVDSINLLKKHGYNINCRIIGDGPLKGDIANKIKDLELGNEIDLLGARPSDFVKNEFQSASIFVLPCVQAKNGDMDGIPVVLMEAIANSVPVVSTRISGIPELIVNKETGLLTEPNDVEGLTNSIRLLIQNKNLREDLVSKAKLHLKDEFTLEKNVEELGELIIRNT